MNAWAGIVGAEFARAGTGADAVDGIVPGCVARPATIDEVRSLVCAAASSGAVVIASGLGGHLDVGAPPRRVDVLLRLDRLSAVRDHQAADMTITAEAGCNLGRLGAVLATTIGTGSELGYGPTRWLAGLGFSLGLILVVVGGAELFTRNNLVRQT